MKKDRNPKNRSSKLVEISEAVKLIKKGNTIAIGGFAIYQRPMAFIREIIRQKINNLTIIGVTNSIDADISLDLIGYVKLVADRVGPWNPWAECIALYFVLVRLRVTD